jgi:putative intracellular protease/amidase
VAEVTTKPARLHPPIGATEIASVCRIGAACRGVSTVSATTNKKAWAWATSLGKNVKWRSHARWVEDGKFFTSSGVSAGMDMSLALIARFLGEAEADRVATYTEYRRQKILRRSVRRALRP